jgi:hypothetical protein
MDELEQSIVKYAIKHLEAVIARKEKDVEMAKLSENQGSRHYGELVAQMAALRSRLCKRCTKKLNGK